jgi:hypothetical protein
MYHTAMPDDCHLTPWSPWPSITLTGMTHHLVVWFNRTHQLIIPACTLCRTGSSLIISDPKVAKDLNLK